MIAGMISIVEANTSELLTVAHELFVEYAEQLGHDLCFQNFTKELEGLPGKYAPPTGCLRLAHEDGAWIGCVAIRPGVTDGVCEMKRLYVRAAARGRGLGRQLAINAIDAARAVGYKKVVLDTLSSMTIPRTLYRSLGFVEIEPYYDNPIPGAVYLGLEL